jgi:hypothetical protein
MTGFNLQPFMENIANFGVVQSSKYDVSITLPPLMKTNASKSQFAFINSFTNIIPFRAISCTTPGAAFLMNETNKWGIGPRIKQPYNVGFADIRITFLADSEAVIETFCSTWMNLTYNFSYSATNQATFLTNFRKDKDTGIASPSVNINKYDRQGNLISTYILTDVVPTLFVPSPLDWNATDDLAKFTLGLNYTTFDII